MISIELKKRIVTSFILLTIFFLSLFINDISWLILLTIISFICGYEFFKIINKAYKNKKKIFIIYILSTFYLLFFIFLTYKIKKILGIDIALFILLTCVLSDIGGYVVGKIIGGKKLTKISPNKTVSGSFGSFLFCLIPLLFFDLSEYSTDLNFLLLCSLIISLSCQLGDLFISYFKRRAKVKDTGNFLPGHGGLLDRIDGIIFGAPTAFLLLQGISL